jgi:hypothetical protein
VVCRVALTVRGFEKRRVDKGLTCGCAFKWLKIGGHSKEIDNFNFWMGMGDGRVFGGHFLEILRVGRGIWVGFFFPEGWGQESLLCFPFAFGGLIPLAIYGVYFIRS